MIMNNDAAEIPSNAANIVWLALLILAGLGGSLVISCVTPFVALAVALAGTVRLRLALFAITAIWVTNQLIGFAFLHFPQTPNSVLWGLASGLAALLSTVVAAHIIDRSASSSRFARLGLALALGFAVYEGALFLAALFLGGLETFSPVIMAQIGSVNLAWFFGLVGLNEIASVLLKPVFGPTPRLAKA